MFYFKNFFSSTKKTKKSSNTTIRKIFSLHPNKSSFTKKNACARKRYCNKIKSQVDVFSLPMSTSAFEHGEYLTCPFNSAHQVLSDNFKHHITRCSQVSHGSVQEYPLFFLFSTESSPCENDSMSVQWGT